MRQQPFLIILLISSDLGLNFSLDGSQTNNPGFLLAVPVRRFHRGTQQCNLLETVSASPKLPCFFRFRLAHVPPHTFLSSGSLLYPTVTAEPTFNTIAATQVATAAYIAHLRSICVLRCNIFVCRAVFPMLTVHHPFATCTVATGACNAHTFM